MFVPVNNDVITPALWNSDRQDFIIKQSVILRRLGFLLAPEREGVLILPGYMILLGHIFRRLTHGINTVLVLHFGINKPPADGVVIILSLK